MFLPEDWPANDGFFSTPFIAKLLLMPIWVKLILAKYLSMWLMAEGICAVSGLSYVGLKETDSGPKADWTGCANVKLRRLESAQKFGHYIEAFNINTNSWVNDWGGSSSVWKKNGKKLFEIDSRDRHPKFSRWITPLPNRSSSDVC